MVNSWIRILSAVLCLWGPRVVADDFPTTPPTGGQPRDFKLPVPTRIQLDNGARATLVPWGALPKVTVSIVIRVGNLDEDGQTWLSDLTGEMMREGTLNRSAADIDREAAAMGGGIKVRVGLERTTITGECLSEFGPEILALMAEMVREPAFPASELERLRGNMLRHVRVALSQPRTQAFAAFRRALYGDHAFGRIFPDEAQLQSYTLDQVEDFHARNFGARRAHVYVAGVYDPTTMQQAIHSAFADWQPGPDPRKAPPAAATGRQMVDLIDRPGAHQSNVWLGLPVPDPSHPDHLALRVTNALLGGSFGSRITANLREDKGYSYSPHSQLSVRFRDAYWVETAAVSTEFTGEAIEEIYKEINMLANIPPSEQELEGIRNYLTGVFTLQNATRQGLINQLSYADLHELGEDYLTGYVRRIQSTTPAQVQAAAQRHLRPADMTLVIVGDGVAMGAKAHAYLDGDPAP